MKPQKGHNRKNAYSESSSLDNRHRWRFMSETETTTTPQRHKTHGALRGHQNQVGVGAQAKTKRRETMWAVRAWSILIPGAPHFSTSLTRVTSYLRIGKHPTHTQPTPIILLILAVKTPRTRTRTDVVRWHALRCLSTNPKETPPRTNDKPPPRPSKRAGILDWLQLG